MPRDEVLHGHAVHGISAWLFAFMSLHASSSAHCYGLQSGHVVELGVQGAL
ncbi:hypothetical protein F4827_004250 [Paraburkholderia bannensis]|uniref:Uncharacterized protein n=1 Tax=Paraburkholderia bannensis TaxID=765414 RepID=A0A7W9U167_9BURK|nr:MULTISPECIES: hypothetical protein [Paraburkholderia]MBB3259375.1 hypothetical protein [Paraburkholderia sp. WP4_3_2]MBB6104391.1 hypothetical protein [Paraburkholderia bannensis]